MSITGSDSTYRGFITYGTPIIINRNSFDWITSRKSNIKVGGKSVRANILTSTRTITSATRITIKPLHKEDIPEYGEVPVQYGDQITLQNEDGEYVVASGQNASTGGCGIVYFTKSPTKEDHAWSFKAITMNNSPFVSYAEQLNIIPKRYPKSSLCLSTPAKQCNTNLSSGSYNTRRSICVSGVNYNVLYKPYSTKAIPSRHACASCSGSGCSTVSTKYKEAGKKAIDKSVTMCKHEKGYTIPIQRSKDGQIVCICGTQSCSKDSDCPPGQECSGGLCAPVSHAIEYLIIFVVIVVGLSVLIWFIYTRSLTKKKLQQNTGEQKMKKEQIKQRLSRE